MKLLRECNNKHYALFVTTFVSKLKICGRNVRSDKEQKAQQHERIELLIYRIYCWKRKTRAFVK